MQAVIFGAGSVGRGFIGQLFCEAGWGVTFVDVAPTLIDALASDGCYPHVTVSTSASVRTVISPVTAIAAGDVDATVAALVAADAAATAVGARVLGFVAPVLAQAIAARIERGKPPLNVLLCENLHGAADVVRAMLEQQLPDLPAAVLDANVGLLETSIGRMIPVPDPATLASEPTVIFAEPYKQLPYDVAAVRGAPLDVPGLVANPSVPFAFFGDRKLYIHNMGHVMTAYLGERAGVETIAEAIAIPALRLLVRAAMVESAVALAGAYDVPLSSLLDHVDDLIHRFGNTALGDTVERVGRDPIRKVAAGDRILGAYTTAFLQRTPTRYLSLAVAVGADALRRHEGWSDAQIWAHLQSGLPADAMTASQLELLQAQMHGLSDGRELQWQVGLIDTTYEPSRIL